MTFGDRKCGRQFIIPRRRVDCVALRHRFLFPQVRLRSACLPLVTSRDPAATQQRRNPNILDLFAAKADALFISKRLWVELHGLRWRWRESWVVIAFCSGIIVYSILATITLGGWKDSDVALHSESKLSEEVMTIDLCHLDVTTNFASPWRRTPRTLFGY